MADTISSDESVAADEASNLAKGLEEYRSFRLGSASASADGIPPSNHDSISQAVSSYCSAYASAMERDASNFSQIGVSLSEADAMAAVAIEESGS